jgi:nitrogen-specific signal transduction histidine kinase/FixJ family two-component response regulator
MAIHTDVTEQRRLQAQLLRTQRLESLGTLAGGIAHDLNNVLTPILMATGMLDKRIADEASRQLLATIDASASRGADLVRRILAFARGAEGPRVVVDVARVVQEVLKLVEETFPPSIRIACEVDPGLWSVRGDATHLHQLLLNLCVNARDAMLGGGKLAIAVANVALTGQPVPTGEEGGVSRYVQLRVTDTGTGIPPEIVERIFDPFFTTKAPGEGTGLGLATVEAIVRSHRGFLNVTSVPGSGTTFEIHLPASETTRAAAPPGPAKPPRGSGELILVVDDETAVRVLAQRALEAFGYRVVAACDGAEAVAAFAEHGTEVAAVLLDMTMPVMDGPAALAELRASDPEVPVIAASGLPLPPAVTERPELRPSAYLPKPYLPDALLRAVAETIATRRYSYRRASIGSRRAALLAG